MYCLHKRSVFFVAIIFVSLQACHKKPASTGLYNVDSLITQQVVFYKTRNATLQKQATMGEIKDDTIYRPKDSTAWEHELGILRSLQEINKPVNKSKYIVDDGLFDVSSNLTVKAYSAVDDLPVKYIRVFYAESVNKPRKIEALYLDKNEMFSSARLFTLEFQQYGDKSMMTSYAIEGGQKMILKDTVTFTIKGKIVID